MSVVEEAHRDSVLQKLIAWIAVRLAVAHTRPRGVDLCFNCVPRLALVCDGIIPGGISPENVCCSKAHSVLTVRNYHLSIRGLRIPM